MRARCNPDCRRFAAMLAILASFPACVLAQGAGPTGWCTDASGRNFRCGAAPAPPPNVSPQPQRPRPSGGVAPGSSARQAAQGHNSAGLRHIAQKDYAGAIARYQQALRADPSYTVAKDNLGKALGKLGFAAYQRGDYLSAILYYERALSAGHGVHPSAAKDKTIFRQNIADIKAVQPAVGTPSCATCARALLSDLGYGLDASASFRAYATGAAGNYANCRQRTLASCAGDRGDRLHRNVATCQREQALGAAFKSCVRTVVRGARLGPD